MSEINRLDEEVVLTEQMDSQTPIENGGDEKKSNLGFFIFIGIIAVFVAVVLYLNTQVFFLVRVVGASMEPTLQSGDVLVVNKKQTAERGDIIIIDQNNDGKYIIKRLIAMDGDTVEIKEGFVFINGEKLEEAYFSEQVITTPQPEDSGLSKWQLKEGEVFFLGDNRGISRDSRDQAYGPCTKEEIVGVVEENSKNYMWFTQFIYRLGRGTK